jgi:hypothetical protein
MYVRSLDRSDLLNGDLVEDFLAVCGVTESTDKHRLVRTGLQNASPGWRVLEAMRALSGGYHGLASNHPLQSVRRHGIFLGECAFEVGEARGWNTDRGRYLTRDQAQRCYDIYRRSVLVINEKLQRKLPLPLGLDERGFSAREFVPHLKHIPRQELNAFYDDLWDAFRSSESTP